MKQDESKQNKIFWESPVFGSFLAETIMADDHEGGLFINSAEVIVAFDVTVSRANSCWILPLSN